MDVFFVLSGFILGLRYPKLTAKDFAWFSTKRLCRVYPLHAFVLLSLGIAASLAPLVHMSLNNGGGHTGVSFLRELLLVHPLFAVRSGWNEPSWSLAVEVVCYFTLPVAMTVLQKLPFEIRITILVILFALEPLVLAIYGNSFRQTGAFSRGMSGFYLGVLFSQVQPKLSRSTAKSIELACCLIAVLAFCLGRAYLVPPVVSVLLLQLRKNEGVTAALLAHPSFHFLGKISFSFYLIQAPIILMVRDITRRILSERGVVLDSFTVSLVFGAVTLLVLLFAAVMLYRFVEQPSHRWAERIGTCERRLQSERSNDHLATFSSSSEGA